jgi:hypothetical protein
MLLARHLGPPHSIENGGCNLLLQAVDAATQTAICEGSENEDAQNQSPAQEARANVQLVACDPKARAGVPALAQLRDFLPRCSPATELEAFARSRRSEPRVWTGQCPLADREILSIAAIDDTRNGMIQINAADRLPSKNSGWHHFPKLKWAQSRLSFSAWL